MAEYAVYIQLALFVYSVQRQQELAARMQQMQDAQKGYEVVTEAQGDPVPIVYGRNIIGGSRVYHKTSGTYNQFTKTWEQVDAFDPTGTDVFVKNLSDTQSANKNDFLFYQQVLCHGPINKAYEIVVDDARFFSNSDFDHGMRIHATKMGKFYTTDPMMEANFDERKDAHFTDLAYASICLKLNRDNPQFQGGVPQIQFMVEGLKITTITQSGPPGGPYTYQTTLPTYSNNPAYCLLDYLTNTRYGRGISENQIDLESFYKAAQICNQTVMTNVSAQGNIWRPTNGSRNVITRDIPLFECNLILDPENPIRDNVLLILETMKGAELVWSGGKYKLLLQYPESNEAIESAGTITDDDIIPESISIKWPSANERLNYVKLKFKNEAQNFKEDTVTWPPKGSPLYSQYLQEDNQVPLITEFFEPGIKDYYHALSKAEERVRRSRYSVIYSFSIRVKGIIYEPGDIIQLQSDLLNIPNEYIQIQSIKFNEDYTATIEGVRFDSQMLAWNVLDTEPSVITPSYSFTITPPTNLAFVQYNSSSLNYAYGSLNWTAPSDDSANSYLIEYKRFEESDSAYRLLGETIGTSFEISNIYYGYYSFRIKSKSLGGKLSNYSIAYTTLIDDGTSEFPIISLSEDLVLTNGAIEPRLLINITNTSEPVFFAGYEIEVSQDLSNWISLGITRLPQIVYSDITDNTTYYIRGRVINAAGKKGDYSIIYNKLILGKQAKPNNISGFVFENNSNGTLLSWDRNNEVDFLKYHIRKGNDWNNSVFIDYTTENFYLLPKQESNSYIYLIKAVDTSNNESLNETSVNVVIPQPTQPSQNDNIHAEVADRSLILSWDPSYSPYLISEYIISSGEDEIARIKTTKYTLPITWSGTKSFSVVSVDTYGNHSDINSVEVVIGSYGKVEDLKTQVIDNNVLLYWKPPIDSGTLPVSTYRIKKGNTWNSAILIGDTNALFSTYFETQAGTYTYWVAAIDSSLTEGVPQSTTIAVSQPPDYQLLVDYYTDFLQPTSIRYNMYDNAGDGYVLPVNTTETWSQHFITEGWTNIQDAITAGFTSFIQPTLSTGYYEEIYDYQLPLPSTKLTLSVSSIVISGSPTFKVYLSTSTDGITYTPYEETSELFVTGIRYVKFKVEVASSTNKDLLQINQINLVIDSKIKSDSGRSTVTDAVNGKIVYFNTPFLDISAINISPVGTSPKIAMYDFVDIPMPTYFTVYLFDLAGNKITGDFSWNVTGY